MISVQENRGRELVNEKSNNGVSDQIFSEFIEEWFTNQYQNKVLQSTLSINKIIVEKHLLLNNPFSNKEISKITCWDINLFYQLKIKENYSIGYIRKMQYLLKQAFSHAVGSGKINSSPFVKIKPPTFYNNISYWSKEDIDIFIENCKTEVHYITFLLAIFTGIKKNELLALKWNDIDFEKEVIHIKRKLASNQNMGYLTNNIERLLPIPGFVINELYKHKKSQDNWNEIVRGLYSDQELAICTITGNFEKPHRIDYELRHIIKKYQLKEINFRDFRHTFAAMHILNGVNMLQLSKMLGYSNYRGGLNIYLNLRYCRE